jgi:hypothetical protein
MFLLESVVQGGSEKIMTRDQLALHSAWWLEWAGDGRVRMIEAVEPAFNRASHGSATPS